MINNVDGNKYTIISISYTKQFNIGQNVNKLLFITLHDKNYIYFRAINLKKTTEYINSRS